MKIKLNKQVKDYIAAELARLDVEYYVTKKQGKDTDGVWGQIFGLCGLLDAAGMTYTMQGERGARTFTIVEKK